jgi:hypothetical protein
MTLEQPDYFTEEFTSSDNDLDQWTVVFTPDGSGDYYDMCGYESTALPTDPAGGTTLPLSDDDSEIVTPDEAVFVYGQSYTSFHVGSNGYLTFGGSDTDYTETLDDHFGMVRVAGLFDDLNPNSGGTISWKELGDRVAITWENVPEFYDTGSNTFQIELFFDGTIRITWLSIDAPDGIVGISGGDGMPSDYEETDMSAAGPCVEPCPADLDGSGAVDVADMLALLAAWGATSGPADLNNDGLVDVDDLLILMAAWGSC